MQFLSVPYHVEGYGIVFVEMLEGIHDEKLSNNEFGLDVCELHLSVNWLQKHSQSASVKALKGEYINFDELIKYRVDCPFISQLCNTWLLNGYGKSYQMVERMKLSNRKDIFTNDN